jgi:hypothetical protein
MSSNSIKYVISTSKKHQSISRSSHPTDRAIAAYAQRKHVGART